ncbi:polysaccharide biosynthesis tyrosine autokinase [uncultured Caballeronia sp.]|jgi:tyrosine-protein kinase Etk/Wzc|uniref:polysaccharide biosynthesis tyrosine autokinase n=1 Tax=uncultured Caballeronia sp. TaxID=1827198 RepID=UPI001575DED7
MSFNTTNPTAPSTADDEIDLSEIAAVLWESKLLISVIAAGTLALGIAYAVLSTPVFRADAMVQVDDNSGVVNDKLGDLAELFGGKATADAEIELIRSRELVDDTVRRLHLDITAKPRYFPLVGGWIARAADPDQLADPVWGLGGYAWGGEKLDVTQFDVPPSLYDKKFTLIAGSNGSFELRDPDGNAVIKGHLGQLSTGTTSKGAVSLTVNALVARPGTAFKLARASTQLVTEELQKKLDISEKVKQSGIVAVRLDGTDSVRTAATVNTIVRGYVQRNVGLKSGQAQQMLGFLGDQLPDLKSGLDSAEQRYNSFRNKNGTVDLEAESRLLLQSIVDGKSKIIALQQQRADLMQRFTANHPSVASIDAQLADLQREQSQLNARVATVPNTQQAAGRLLRDVDVNTGLYMNLMTSEQQLRVLKAGQQGNVRVVDYAVVAEQPVKPKKLIVVGAAGVLGLLLGVGVALLRRVLNRGLEDTLEVEEVAGTPVYAVILRSARQLVLQRFIRRGDRGPHVLAMSAPDDLAVEGIRSLRTALLFHMGDAPNNVVMIAGPRSDIGKSFLSVNLAAVLAAAGKRVLLIDADLRRGDVHFYFGKRRDPGLHDVMSGAVPIENAIRRQVLPNLDLLTRGAISASPSEILMSDRLGRVIERLAPLYDVVIVDTPPVLAATDSSVIGMHAGTTLLVLRHGQHSATELRESMRLLRGAGVSVSGIVLTDAPQRSAAHGTYSSYASVKD